MGQRRILAALGTLGWMLAVASSPIGSATPSPEAEPALRVCADLREISAPTWKPVPRVMGVDAVATEVVLQLLSRAVDRRGSERDVVLLGMDQIYEVVALPEDPARIAKATHRLQTELIPIPETGEVTVVVRLEGLTAADPGFEARHTGDAAATSVVVVRAVEDLLAKLELVPRTDPSVLASFTEHTFEHHREVAESRIYRLLGRRFGKAHEAGLVKRAEIAIEDALRSGPDDIEAILEKLALVDRELNLATDLSYLDEESELLERAALLGADAHYWYHVRRGVHSIWRGEQNLALEQFRSATRLDPLHGEAYFQIALTYLQSDEPRVDEAISLLERAIGVNPAMLRSRAYLGRAWGEKRMWPAADRTFTELLEIRKYGLGLFEQAVVSWWREDHASALESLDELLDSPDFYAGDVHDLKAIVLLDAGFPGPAERSLVSSLRISYPDHEPLFELYLQALDFEESGEAEAARDRFERVRLAASPAADQLDSIEPFQEILLGLTTAHLSEPRRAKNLAQVLEDRYPTNETAVWIAIVRIHQIVNGDTAALAPLLATGQAYPGAFPTTWKPALPPAEDPARPGGRPVPSSKSSTSTVGTAIETH